MPAGTKWSNVITVWRNNDYTPAFDTSYNYMLQPLRGNYQVSLDVNQASQTNGTAVQQWATSASANQQFNLLPVSGGAINRVKITMMANNKKCVDLAGGKTADGTLLVINDCNGSPSQTWFVTPNVQTGAFFLTNSASGTCMDVPSKTGQSQASGLQIEIWGCNGGDNQKWKIFAH
jgi:Ricin-type beta-trefoil lectin domain